MKINSKYIADILFSQLPQDKIIVKYLDGNPPRTIEIMRREVENETELGLQFLQDILSISINFMMRAGK